MEITEYVPEKAFGGVIKEGGFEIPGRAKFESVDPNRTRITLSAEMPSMSRLVLKFGDDPTSTRPWQYRRQVRCSG